MGVLADAIIWSLENETHRWRPGNYTHGHDGGVHIWIGNGPLSVEVYSPQKISFGLLDRWRIWRAYRRASRTRPDLVKTLKPTHPGEQGAG